MKDPVGYLLTWSCYGARLHGDARGSVDASHNEYGAPRVPPSARRVTVLQKSLKHSPTRLGESARQLVTDVIKKHCEVRGWELLAVNVRSNHVHVAIGNAGVSPESMMGQFKAWCTRRLRDASYVLPDQTVWTTHGSTRYVWNRADLEAAYRYVVDGQDAERFADETSGH